MLEYVPATDQICLIMSIALIIYISDDLNGCLFMGLTHIAGIESQSPVIAAFTEQSQEIALTCPDFDYLFIRKRIRCYETIDEVGGERLKAR
jgi:hypothetical protein